MSSIKPIKPTLIIFDVYETILNMSDIERRVNDLLDSKRGYSLWFELFMQYMFVDNCTIQFHDFTSIGEATLRMTAQMLNEKIDSDNIHDIMERLKHLPLQEGVQEGLSELHDRGFRIAALTNSPEKIVRDRMERTGLISYFEQVLSSEKVGKYKPDLSVYRWALNELNTLHGEALLVSAHGWDIAGAENAGIATAYIRQNKQLLYPLAPVPDFTCKDIPDLAHQLNEIGKE